MCQMLVRRTVKNHNYTVMDNTFLQDKRLSWKAKGLFAYLLSLPEDWKIYLEEVKEHAADGIDSLRSGLKELQELGYVNRVQNRNVSGQYSVTIYELNETPELPMPEMSSPVRENPISDNPTLLSTNIQNTNNTKYTLSESDSLHSSDSEQSGKAKPKKQGKVINREQLEVIKSQLTPDNYPVLKNLYQISEDSFIMTEVFNTCLADVIGEDKVNKLNSPRVKDFKKVFGIAPEEKKPTERQVLKNHYLENKKGLYDKGCISSPCALTGGVVIEQRLNEWVKRGLTFEQIAKVLDFAMTDEFCVKKLQYDLQKMLSDTIFNRLLNSPKCKAMQKMRPVEAKHIVIAKCPTCGEELDSFGKCVFCN